MLKYYYVDEFYKVLNTTDDGHYIHFKRKLIGNYFKTKKVAERVSNLMMATLNLLKEHVRP